MTPEEHVAKSLQLLGHLQVPGYDTSQVALLKSPDFHRDYINWNLSGRQSILHLGQHDDELIKVVGVRTQLLHHSNKLMRFKANLGMELK